jgi:phage baseplate assembly protein gpV
MTTVRIGPQVVVDARDLPADALRSLTSIRVERAVNVVGQATLRFDDMGYQLSAQSVFKIGGRLEIRSGTELLFQGTVHSVALETVAEHVPELVIAAREPTQKLAEHRSPRAFEKQSHKGIVTKLASTRGLEAEVDASLPLHGINPYLLQTDTDLALLDELVRTRGGMWWFEPPKTIRVASVAPPTSAPIELEVGGDQVPYLLTFSVRATAGQPAAARAVGWDPGSKNAVVGKAKAAPPASESMFVNGARRPKEPGGAIVTNAGDPLDAAEAGALADAILTSVRSDVVSGRGTCTVDPRIAPGVAVKVSRAGPSSGTYLVTRVEHAYDRRGFHTTFHTGSHRPRGLVDTVGNGRRPDSRIDGVVAGIVTDLKDEENLGRVRVKFPFLQEQVGKDVASAWARVASFDAGNGRGALFLPEVDDEVLVAFEHGDLRRPVVLGALFGATNKQPDLGDLLKDGKIRSRRMTSRAGHVFEMVDEKGEAKVLLKHGKKPFSITMDEKTESVTVEATDGEIKLTNGKATITLDKSGNITIDGQALKITTKQGFAVDATTTAEVKSKTDLKVEGMNVTVKGTAATTVQGGASTAIKGGTVMIN